VLLSMFQKAGGRCEPVQTEGWITSPSAACELDHKVAAAGLTVTFLSGRQICFQAGWYRAFIASLHLLQGRFLFG